jgi:ABC-type transport system involved in cytochrome c biogenesis permease component
VVAFWFVLMGSQRWSTFPQKGHQIFHSLGILALAFSVLAGLFLTADCLSEEKREGTLGLLFLTDLRGYDIVLGKLAAHSLQASFGLLAVFPVLALPLLMGGVTLGEFWRLVLLLVVTLFFSLGLGMLSSVIAREARQAVIGCLLGLVFFAGICPALWWIPHLLFPPVQMDLLLLPSPGFAFMRLFSTGTGQTDYWLSLLILFLLGLSSIVLASVLLPRRRQQGETAVVSGRSGASWRFRGVPPGTLAGAFAENPFYWLTSRDRLPKAIMWGAIGLLLPLWMIFLLASLLATRPHPGFIAAMITAFALHLVCKSILAMEASRRLSEDRQSGALELLLVTPLSPKAIVAGQLAALKAHFRPALIVLSLMNAGLILMTLVFEKPLSMNTSNQLIFFEMFAGGVVMLLFDFAAIPWVAMSAALRTRKHHRAVLNTLLRVMIVPWLIMAVIILSQPRVSATGGGFIIGFWFLCGIIIDAIMASRARYNLIRYFRALVTADTTKSPTPLSPTLDVASRPTVQTP